MIQSIAHRCAELLGQDSGLIELGRPAYERALNFVCLGRGISWSINGMPCRIDARFRSSMGQRYDPEVAALLRHAVQPGSLCFDVGANLGVYVLQFAHWSKPDGTVVAFEPNPTAARALRRHVDMNNLTGRVLVVDQALSDEEGTAEFYAAGCNGMSRLSAPNPRISDRATAMIVPVTTIDSFVDRSGLLPGTMLIDVEGFEIKVLAGAQLTLSKKPGMVLVVEMHPNVWASAGTSREQTESLLSTMNLKVTALTGQRDPFEEHGLVTLTSTNLITSRT